MKTFFAINVIAGIYFIFIGRFEYLGILSMAMLATMVVFK